MNKVPVHVLKDDGRNTNVVSRSAFSLLSEQFHVKSVTTMIPHSIRGTSEEADELVPDVQLQLGQH